MIDFYINANVYIQVLIATLMTWGITTLGAALVFFFKKVNSTTLDAMMGLSAGVMIAASFFSLLNPAVLEAKNMHMNVALVLTIGFLIGSLMLILSDNFFTKVLNRKKEINAKGLKRSLMLMLSITLHNIPEGLAIGVAFGSIKTNTTSLMGAFMLAVGIAIQNFPEGSAISLPLRRENFSRMKSFVYGSLSGIVEPLAGLVGCLLVLYVKNILPYFLSFAAGAMIYVAVSELIPESQNNKCKNLMSFFTLLGFTIMMILDVTFS